MICREAILKAFWVSGDMCYDFYIEMFYLNSTFNFGIPSVLVFQLEVYYKVDRLLTAVTSQQKGTTAQWYSNKTSLDFMF